MLAVDVRQLTKTYLVPERGAGLGAAVHSVFRRGTRAVEAVAEVSFALQPGEFVGFVGPNGAGRILFDGALQELVRRFSPHKTIVVELDRDAADLSGYGEVVASEGSRHTLLVPKADTPQVTARLLGDLPVGDLTVEDPPIEDVIEQVFAGALDGAEGPQPREHD